MHRVSQLRDKEWNEAARPETHEAATSRRQYRQVGAGILKRGQGTDRQGAKEQGTSHEGTTVEGWGAGCVWLGCYKCLACDKSVSEREQGLLQSGAPKKEVRGGKERVSLRGPGKGMYRHVDVSRTTTNS